MHYFKKITHFGWALGESRNTVVIICVELPNAVPVKGRPIGIA